MDVWQEESEIWDSYGLEGANHITDCYFCAIDLNGINRKNRGTVKYPDLHSARRPVAHCDEIPVTICKELPDVSDEDVSSIEVQEEEKGADVDFEYDTRQRFSQQELNDPVRDLGLSKLSAQLMASKLREKSLLSSSTRISFYRNRHQENLRFFCEEKDLVYCSDIAQLLLSLGVTVRTQRLGTLH